MEEGWERPPRLDLQLDELNHLVEPAFPGKTIGEFAVLAAGLANTNIRFRLAGQEETYVLRLHTRDPTAAERERELMVYLTGHSHSFIPVPPLVYSDPTPERGEYPYSIWGFIEGTLLQELFRTLPAPDLVAAAGACGKVLASFATYPFLKCGEFGSKLQIVQEYGSPSRFVPEMVHRALFKGIAGERLGVELRDALWSAVERTSPLLTEIDDRYTLVHADYKRSNLLMKRSAMGWEVAAVLDWEFACAGPPLIDVGLFLRAGEALPDGFRDAFVSSYRNAGGMLHSEWLRLSRLIDVISQMTFLEDPRDRPRVFAETTEVVKETVRMLA